MSRSRHLVIFTRLPRLGTGKRRLARDIGALAALDFQHRNLTALFQRLAPLRSSRPWRVWLALTPDGAAKGRGLDPVIGRFLNKGRVETLAQGGGDLGVRMGRIFTRLPPGPAVIIGSDIPAITTDMISAAFAQLGGHDFVFGPAGDGGYWLVGAARRRPMGRNPRSGLFSGVRWSTADALADTLANLEKSESAGFIDQLDDIDDGAAYRRWRLETG